MRIEHGLCPDEPGMGIEASIIPEDFRCNPECPCATRTCAYHGFCKYCVVHHQEINERIQCTGVGHLHGPYCQELKKKNELSE